MAFDGSDECWIPRVPIAQQKDLRLRIAKFGDGYQQRILDGINALNVTFHLVWDQRPNQELLAMDAYLAAQKGAAFVFQHPMNKVEYNVFCDSWNVTWDIHRPNRKFGQPSFYGTLEADFVVAYGVTVGALP